MAKILIAWEFGGGLGHVARLRPIAQELCVAGHQLVIASRNVPMAAQYFGDLPTPVLQAPIAPFAAEQIKVVYSFSHILYNCSYAVQQPLLATARAWRGLFDLIRPQLLIADFSPTALLTARGSGIKTIALGTGFECPPDEAPLPSIRPGPAPDESELLRIEEEMLSSMNGAARALGSPSLERVADLFHQNVSMLLLTYPELDPYVRADRPTYYGAHAHSLGKSPRWPLAAGPRLFVYLKATGYLERQIAAIASLGWPTIVYASPPANALKERFQGPTVSIETEILSHEEMVRECDLAITNGGHLLTASLLLAGKPIVIVPQSLEQRLNAERIKSLGVGAWIDETAASHLAACIREVSESPEITALASNFAHKHNNLNATRGLRHVMQAIEGVMRQ